MSFAELSEGVGVAHPEIPLFHRLLSRWKPVLASSSECPGVPCIPKDKGWQAMKGLLHSFTAPASTHVMSLRMEAAVIRRDGHSIFDVMELLFQHRVRCRSRKRSDRSWCVLTIHGISHEAVHDAQHLGCPR